MCTLLVTYVMIIKKLLHIMLPKISAYVKSYDGQTKRMYFMIEDDDLLEKYNTIWEKVSSDIKKEFDSEPVCNNFFSKPKQNLMVIKLKTFMVKNS